jgi:hypothetical protein
MWNGWAIGVAAGGSWTVLIKISLKPAEPRHLQILAHETHCLNISFVIEMILGVNNRC